MRLCAPRPTTRVTMPALATSVAVSTPRTDSTDSTARIATTYLMKLLIILAAVMFLLLPLMVLVTMNCTTLVNTYIRNSSLMQSMTSGIAW